MNDMKTKIALLIPFGRDAGEEVLKWSGEVLLKDVGRTKNDDTEVVPCYLEQGYTDLEALAYNYFGFRSDREMYEAMLKIEDDGYDAIMLNCWYDPALGQGRQALDIPIVGPSQVSTLFASMMGKRIGIVTFTPLAIPTIEANIERYGLIDKVALPVRAIRTSFDDQIMALFNADAEIQEFKRVARECIAQGADVLIPACMAMSPALSVAPGCEEEYPEGLKEVDGVAVVDILALMVKVVEGMVALKRAGRPWVSRKSTYAKASKEVEERAIAAIAYRGAGYFTV